MEIQDDRTEEQKETHDWLWVGTDTSLSGWGKAKGGESWAAWAHTPHDSAACEAMIRARSGMKRIRQTFARNFKPRVKGHLHIYVF